MAPYVYVWRFTVRSGSESAFEELYGPDGDWARLFRRSADWLGTDLLRDRDRPGDYLTVDRWASAEALDAFRAAVSSEWDEIDRRGDDLTSEEVLIGHFDLAGG